MLNRFDRLIKINDRPNTERRLRSISIERLPQRSPRGGPNGDPELDFKRYRRARRIRAETGRDDPHRSARQARGAARQRRRDQPGDHGGERRRVLRDVQRRPDVRAAGVAECVGGAAVAVAGDRPADAVQRAGVGPIRVGVQCGGGQG